ncbi:MAG: hypothetical protein ACRDXD_01045 [Acidimicrobiia bacterium]
MSEIRIRSRRSLPRVAPPEGPWAHLLDATGPELTEAVHAWFEAGGVPIRDRRAGQTPIRIVEGGPQHGFFPAMLRLAEPDRFTVLVVSPFPGAEQAARHLVRPHPDLESAARRLGVRLTRVWDLVLGGPEFARDLVAPGEGGFLAR